MAIYSIYACDTEELFEISEEQWQKNCEEKAVLLRYLAVPLKENSEKVWLAIDNQNNLTAGEIFSFLRQKQVEPVLVESETLKYLLNQLSSESQHNIEEKEYHEFLSEHDLSIINFNDPIIQILDNLFKFCIQKNASDIHIEPHKTALYIRIRIDGVLHLYKTFPLHFCTRIVTRIKLLAKLDISESRLPQDGQFSFTTAINDVLDFRVSTLPIQYGEKLVLRLQKNKPTQLDFISLGFSVAQQEIMLSALNQPQGLILVTGPTGSGKSITLYSALNYLNHTERHILTAEDPIEIELEGLIQTQVNLGLNLDFSRLLRTFLRQDPDIIMLGEIRDEESAKMALMAAQTGHLVLSTLHTNDAPSALERLYQLGIQEYEIRQALLLVVAQRLVRKICHKCEGEGCHECYQGYKGRIGVYQCLSRNGKTFDRTTAALDFPTLFESAKQKIQANLTNLSEVQRVVGYV